MFTTSPILALPRPATHRVDERRRASWDGEPIVGETSPPTFYEIVARNSDKCLDVVYTLAEARASVIQWVCHGGANQQWRIEPAGDGTVG